MSLLLLFKRSTSKFEDGGGVKQAGSAWSLRTALGARGSFPWGFSFHPLGSPELRPGGAEAPPAQIAEIETHLSLNFCKFLLMKPPYLHPKRALAAAGNWLS